jgi:triosephosphate isomerase
MIPRKKLIAGNWKMNKTSADGVALVKEIVAAAGKNQSIQKARTKDITSFY